VDGNVARAREWSEKFQHNRVSKRLVKEMRRLGVPFIPLEAKGGGLDQRQVLDCELGAQISKRGRPS
jgi:hypothetical protein